MKATELKKGVYWVGAVDWDLRNFHGYLTQKGSTYNAYLIVDEKITLVDTVKHYLFDEMMDRIKTIIDPAKIDYVISNHVEMDHSGGLPALMKVCPNATIVTSPNGEKGLKQHYGDGWNYKIVDTGDVLNIGNKNLHFVLMQMVHWPDSMATYIPEDKLLLPNDAFGQHIATTARFDDECDWGVIYEEAAKYYANIVLPFAGPVNKALDAIGSVDFDMIAPSHGVIWRRDCEKIVNAYKKWASNTSDNEAVIVYDTMWESTQKMAKTIQKVFEDQGVVVWPMFLQTNHISDIMTKILTAKYICVGSPTLNNGLLPSVAAFLCYLKGLAPKNRMGLAFGSYGWGGQSVKLIDQTLKDCAFNMVESISFQYVPNAKDLQEIEEKLKRSLFS